jgi:hypothetical protein
VVCTAKEITYEDIEMAKADRDAKEANVVKGKRGPKRKSSAPVLVKAKRTRKREVRAAENEIKAMGLESRCSVLQL